MAAERNSRQEKVVVYIGREKMVSTRGFSRWHIFWGGKMEFPYRGRFIKSDILMKVSDQLRGSLGLSEVPQEGSLGLLWKQMIFFFLWKLNLNGMLTPLMMMHLWSSTLTNKWCIRTRCMNATDMRRPGLHLHKWSTYSWGWTEGNSTVIRIVSLGQCYFAQSKDSCTVHSDCTMPELDNCSFLFKRWYTNF